MGKKQTSSILVTQLAAKLGLDKELCQIRENVSEIWRTIPLE